LSVGGVDDVSSEDCRSVDGGEPALNM